MFELELFYLEDVFLTGIVAQRCPDIQRIHNNGFVVLKLNNVEEFYPETDIIVHLENPQVAFRSLWKSLNIYTKELSKQKGLDV